jgi:hypothetical protein
MIELIAFLGSYFFYCFFSLGAAQMFIDGEGLGFMIAVFFLIPAGIAFGVTSWKSCLNLLGEQVPKGLKVLNCNNVQDHTVLPKNFLCKRENLEYEKLNYPQDKTSNYL